jgi:hypothetical protein
MRPRLCDNVGISLATFNEKRAKRVRLDDFIPGLDRFEQLRVLLTDGFPVESTRNFALSYLMIIDTACPSLSNRVGKVPDSAQHSPASFV